MYSMVLMMAMATSADAPAFGKGGCWGSSCHGGYASCHGCYGSSCHGGLAFGGCHGSSCHGGLAFGGCHGSSCHGGYASCHGCLGSSCYGSSCHGNSCYGSSCHGSCHGGFKLFGGFRHGCHGSSCYGSSCHGSCHGGVITGGCYGSGCIGTVVPTATTPVEIKTETKPVETPKKGGAVSAAPANIRVTVPADATLLVDGIATKATSTSRAFVTPELEAGKVYTYTLKAEVVRNGEKLEVTKQIEVRAGQDTVVELTPATAVAAK